MPEELKKHIRRFVEISDADYDLMQPYFSTRQVGRKQHLLVEGEVCTHNYFVVKGCLRMFFINEKGIEQTMQFAIENWWIADYASFSTQKPAEFYIQSVEKSEVLSLDVADQEKLFEKFPVMERYFRLVHQRVHAATQFRIKEMYSLSREELYHHFNQLHPEFVQRVPQYLLASYLGFTPEYLSEIRNKRIS